MAAALPGARLRPRCSRGGLIDSARHSSDNRYMSIESDGENPILVTGAAGRVGAVGRTIVELLRHRGLPVRAMVRSEDERADALRASGAEVVVGDLTSGADVARAM